MEAKVKEEVFEQLQGDRAYDQGNGASEQHLVACAEPRKTTGLAVPGYTNIIDLSSSSDSSDIEGEDGGATSGKRARDVGGDAEECLSFKRQNNGRAGEVVLPIGFLDPLAPQLPSPLPLLPPPTGLPTWKSDGACKQFWKAGDYEGAPCGDWDSRTGGMDHVRVHPKFLHSNATSHKWALGAFAELLDNALDEVCYGATYVNVDMLQNKKDGSPMLLFEDDGGGMNPEKMRQCMSLGYSAKSKMANTIGQYGNGFKTSTMRLGADVIVFSRCSGKDRSPTQSIGLLSYTFLRSTGKEDIVVPILDYERAGGEWNKIIRSGTADWKRNADTIVEWSPYASEAELLQQFYMMKDHGSRIVIFNLWEDDQGLLELDFESDKHDIQIRGVNREEKNIQMAKQYPNSRHFLTYRHSLRSYVSILYLRLPANFRIIIRGKDVEHHNVVNDMMMSQEVTYRPQASADGIPKDANMVAVVTVGFVKDAKAHIDVQGFNVYHKNRLIKPFWRVWNAAGSDGRGVIGVLEANFVEPAHDKQGFERTTVLARLESKLLNMQKTYWTSHCHMIGYAPRRNIKGVKGSSEYVPYGSAQPKGKTNAQGLDKSSLNKGGKFSVGNKYSNGHDSDKGKSRGTSSSSPEDSSDGDEMLNPTRVHGQSRAHGKTLVCAQEVSALGVKTNGSLVTEGAVDQLYDSQVLEQLRAENNELRERLSKKEEELFGDLVRDLQFEKDKRISIEKMLQEKEDKIEEMNREQESLIDIFSEERDRRDIEEENLRKKLKDASTTIKELLDKVKLLENLKPEKMRG